MKCKCSGEIIQDSGEYVCTSCGMIHGYEEAQPAIISYVGPFWLGSDQTTMGMSNTDHTGNAIRDVYKLVRMRRSNIRARSGSRSLPTAMVQLSKLGDDLHMPQACRIYAADLVSNLISQGFLAGRRITDCVAAVALIACRKHGMNTTINAVAHIHGIKPNKLYRAYSTIIRAYDMAMPVRDPAEYIAVIADRAKIGEEAKRDAYKILEAIDSTYTCGHDPKGLAASALYTSCVARGDHIPRDEIATAAGMASSTLTSNIKVMSQYAPMMVPARKRRTTR